jgi:putative ABC transport system ATP-binding protein
MTPSTPPAPPGATRTLDALMAALEVLVDASSATLDRREARLVLARALGEPGAARGAGSLLARHAAELGLAMRAVEVTPAGALDLVGPDHPALGELEGVAAGWVVLLDRRGAEVSVATLDDPEPRWLDPAALAALLGATGPTARINLWTVERLAALPAGRAHGAVDPVRRALELAHLAREDIKVVAVFAAGVGLLSLVTPVVVQALVNTVAFGTVLQPLVVLTLILVAGLVFSGVLTALEVHTVEVIKRRFLVRIVGDLAHRLPRLHPDELQAHHGPELVNRFFDVFTLHKASATLLLDGLDLVLRLAVGLLLLAFYHPFLLAFDVVLVLGLAFVLVVQGRGAVASAVTESKRKYAMVAWLQTIARPRLALRTAGGHLHARDRADLLTRDYLEKRIDHFRTVMQQTVGALTLQAVASGALLGIGGWLVFQGQLTLGQLVASELVVTGVVGALAKLGKQLETWYDLVAAADKLGHLVDLRMEPTAGEPFAAPPDPRGARVTLRGGAVAMPGRGTVLGGLDLELSPGERVAVLGASGSGKSVLADALFGLRPLAKGQLVIDGMHVRDVSLDALRDRVAVVRGLELIEGSIEDNVRLGQDELDHHHARDALGAVGLLEAVLSLPDGLDTELCASGQPLSEGQAALLVIARSLSRRPSLLVIDGTLDPLDDAARARALEALGDRRAPWTLLVLTRRPELASRFDRVVALEDGAAREPRGGHR